MIPEPVIATVLILLVGTTLICLWLDRREKRFDRQVEIALPVPESETVPSIRRIKSRSRLRLLHRLLHYNSEMSYPWHPGFVVLTGATAAALIVYANGLIGFRAPAGYIAGLMALILVIRGLFRWQQQRLANQLFRQLPDAIQLVTATVRAGLPVFEAFRTIAREMPQPTAGQFAIVCNELSLGRPPEEAVEAVYRRTHVTEYGIFSVTLGVQIKSGGNLAETLQGLGDTVTQRVALAARAKAMAGEVIFSSRALSLAPVIIGGLLYAINPQTVDLLFHDETGNKLLAYAICSVLMGHLMIRWMIKRETAL